MNLSRMLLLSVSMTNNITGRAPVMSTMYFCVEAFDYGTGMKGRTLESAVIGVFHITGVQSGRVFSVVNLPRLSADNTAMEKLRSGNGWRSFYE